ncbi:MAG: nitroreductase family protein, partial [Clostridia bacterium]|nr:nitroreductase family protein [Clostridia bacterium]
YRPGFGEKSINALLLSLEQYSKQYDTSVFFYRTALCVLNEYIQKNREYGHVDEQLNKRISELKGVPNEVGGIIEFVPYRNNEKIFDYANFIKSRHSLRHFSKEMVDIKQIIKALEVAQHTPSACNRQGWKTRIITDSNIFKNVLSNQNGNRGFGQEISSLIIVTGDLRCFSMGREIYQVFIDGGMYAMSILNALHYKELATIPLSASLREDQEKNIRKIVGIGEYEVLIMFIGVGNYPKRCITTRSERRPAEIEIV